MKAGTVIFTILLTLCGSMTVAYSQSLDEGLASLSDQIITGMSEGNKRKIAVIEFSNLDGRITELGKHLSEELITRLFTSKKFQVVERQLLNKIMQEYKLNVTGIIDATTAKKLGSILGVDAICSGTITDLVNSIKVNGRLVSTETGQIFSVASMKIEKDEVISSLMRKVSTQSIIPGTSTTFTSENIFFHEDLSKYERGDYPELYGGLMVELDPFAQKKVLVPPTTGDYSFKINTEFPENFNFSFDIAGDTGNRDSYGLYVTLLDIGGNTFIYGVCPHPYKGGEIEVKLPGNVQSTLLLNNERLFNFRIQKKDDMFKTYLNESFVVSAKGSGYKKFVSLIISFKQGREYGLKWRYRLTNMKITAL